MGPIIEQVQAAIGRHRLIRPGQRVLAAVSGGADSVAMLHLLSALSKPLDFSLHVLHFNHGLRGAESDRDQAFVESLASGLGLPFTGEKLDIRGVAPGRSFENAARAARLEGYAAAALRLQADCVALAHQADDRVETFLMRLIRGAGVEGLASIAPKTRMRGCLLVRPILSLTRAQVEEYLADVRLDFRRDATNDDERLLRNRVRRSLVPLLESSYHPQVRRVLGRTIDQMAALRRWTRAETDRLFGSCARSVEDWGVLLSRDRLSGLPRYPALLLVRRALRELRGEHTAPGHDEAGRLLDWAAAAQPARRETSLLAVDAFCDRESVLLIRRSARRPAAAPVEIAAPGVCDWGGMRLWTGIGPSEISAGGARRPGWALAEAGNRLRFEAVLDGGALAFPLVLRPWRPGDRAAGGKVKELLQRLQVPRPWKRHVPVLVSGASVVWVPGWEGPEGGGKSTGSHSFGVRLELIARP